MKYRLSPLAGGRETAPHWRRLAAVWTIVTMAWACQPTLAATHAAMSAPGAPHLTPELTALERQTILSLGPWPAAPRRDPSNRVSGQPMAIELGRRLFRDARISPVGYISCVTCHQPDRAFADQKPRAHGLGDLPRNTPALSNMAQRRWYGWGGASDSLWMASIRPILDPREFDGSAGSVVRVFVRDPELAACYRRVFGVSALQQPQRTLLNVGKALAAYVETLVTGRTPFDAFRDALAGGDPPAATGFPPAALRGLKVFVGRGQCVACHSGPGFSDDEFHRVALPTDETTQAVAASLADQGRFDGARTLTASAFSLLGPANDDATRRNAAATRAVQASDSLRGRFRTPTLRNVSVTAPYFHDGRVERLADASQHRVPTDAAPSAPSSPPLVAQEIDDLVAFLRTLTDAFGERRPWSGASTARCP